MVWIHGGGFIEGDNQYELYAPDFFLEENVVVVTVAYRLGIFGELIFVFLPWKTFFYSRACRFLQYRRSNGARKLRIKGSNISAAMAEW